MPYRNMETFNMDVRKEINEYVERQIRGVCVDWERIAASGLREAYIVYCLVNAGADAAEFKEMALGNTLVAAACSLACDSYDEVEATVAKDSDRLHSRYDLPEFVRRLREMTEYDYPVGDDEGRNP